MQLREFNRGVREATGIFLSDPWGCKQNMSGMESKAALSSKTGRFCSPY
jgi:hypothetical protein